MAKKCGFLRMAAIAAGSALAIRALLRQARRFDFAGRVVCISGGSRGLGLVLARQLAKQGARLALVARNEKTLSDARTELQLLGAQAAIFPCDIADRRQVDSTVEAIMQRFGRIDVLINDAGIIDVGPMDTMTLDDYRDQMDVHFWGPLYLTMAVLPQMRQRRWGRIVNITSIGGKVSVPHLLPYCASKFAAVGLSEGLREELLKENILVTTVCPGMMRTGSHINAYFKGNNKAEYAWFSIGNSLPVFSVAAEKAASQIIEACRRGDAELIISIQAQLAAKLYQLAPGLMEDVFGIVNMMLPKPDGNGTLKLQGRNSSSWLTQSWLTSFSDSQIMRNNEA